MKTILNIGDLVILKSGSPVMTVEGQDKDKKVLCVWFNRKGDKCSDSFFAETLKNSEIINTEETLTTKDAKLEPAVEPKTKKGQTKKRQDDTQASFD